MSDLKKVYVARGPGDAHVLRSLLESVGVRCVIRGDDFVPLQGGTLMHLETRPSLWVLEDDTYTRALEVVQDYVRRSEGSHGRPSTRGAVHTVARKWSGSSLHVGAAGQTFHRNRRCTAAPRT